MFLKIFFLSAIVELLILITIGSPKGAFLYILISEFSKIPREFKRFFNKLFPNIVLTL